jgi:hypothetical protein
VASVESAAISPHARIPTGIRSARLQALSVIGFMKITLPHLPRIARVHLKIYPFFASIQDDQTIVLHHVRPSKNNNAASRVTCGVC